ncbi:hypothetical protein MUA90_13710 (plasmid) [Staphylococcus sp. IVB6181]|uniref:hypothetical protein n=1 Tax=Staphylococcus sp. IVB6181 TaxID=2929481 RepID=UPI0021CEED3E|nr:hypothetical protein [Staphylococcus sp. IVB6181]UXV36291.1 hypothetical protein MUA90_13710 [Staphylococcus sp. IVB6181]
MTAETAASFLDIVLRASLYAGTNLAANIFAPPAALRTSFALAILAAENALLTIAKPIADVHPTTPRSEVVKLEFSFCMYSFVVLSPFANTESGMFSTVVRNYINSC